MTLSDFNNIRLEYSVGASVIMFSLIDTSINKSVLTSTNVSKVIIEYEYSGNNYSYEQPLSFHCNSCLIILTGLPENTDINFRVYVSYEENNIESYRIALTNVINEHTLPLGNITYTILDEESLQTNVIDQLTSTMDNIISYINNLGTYVDESFDEYATYAKNIPVKYNESIPTADAMYYKYYDSGVFGRVRTSGGSYFKNNVMYHELRHRYGISSLGTNFTRDESGNNSAVFNFIKNEFSIIHDALRFESGRDDAKVWIFEAHSNILEGEYTDNGDYNYLAANYIKALAWYTCHSTLDPDSSKIRMIAPINLTVINGTIEGESSETYYNITFNVINGTANISHYRAKAQEIVYITDIMANQGYIFETVSFTDNETSWTVSSGNAFTYDTNGNPIGMSFIMPSKDIIVTVIFSEYIEEDPYYNIIFNTKNCTANISKLRAKEGDRITISNIVPNPGYKFQAITYSNVSDVYIISEGNIYEFIMSNGDTIINVICIKDQQQLEDLYYNITLDNEHSSGTLNKQSAKGGEEIIIYGINVDDGYELLNIYVEYGDYTIPGIIESDENDTIFRFTMPYYDCKVRFIYKELVDETTIIDNIISKSKNEINLNTKLKTIHLGPYQYLYEYLKNDEDFYDLGCSDSFVILRNFEIVNNIIYDKDIFFIEQSIYNKLINNLKDDLIAYPLYKNGNLFFSNTYGFFTSYNMNLKDISYKIYNESIENNQSIASPANILCDKLRIYNPVINKNLDFIVYVDNYINNIHFHYYCNLNKNLNKKYTGEIKINNNRYIEYIEVNIPNIKKLFSEQNKYFIFEDFNKVAFEENFSLEEFFEKSTKKYDNKLYLSKMIKPFIIDKVIENDETVWVKTYIDDQYFNYNNNFINTSLNITLYPYKNVSNGLYILHDIINSTSTFIEYESYFRLSSRLGFDNGIISLINEFDFPNKIKLDHTNKIEFEKLTSEFLNNKIDKNIQDIEDYQVTEYYNTFYLNENIQNIDLHDEFDEELDIEAIRSTGFIIQFANDLNFTDIILESIINTDTLDEENTENGEKHFKNDNFIYDFSFSLNDMVDSWNQLNDILVVRARFIDKRLNNVITGNPVIINKEWFKYFINDTLDNNIRFDKVNNLITNKFMDINKGYNFIDNINCTISEENNLNSIGSLNNNIITTKLIYKPIFYKVQDLQNIRIRQGVTQNIGVNLGNFLNKVSTFILNIGNQTIKESSRNDVFVIFPINANNIEDNSGYYNIMDENFEYISSGNYIKY